ncbi:TraB/GumN family protein [Devosia sp. YIM 151766]|uniref:TraB/GumN family protein n=1 Tax=Devosia sp. YIM 151766 TaxID=3017325 RepID=UPI00255C9E8F|nr:TraB/GumN family protein [Devosia sp. YIM 151766]WIY54088.1 TraB/GumN family protein [Devosia sp. YIM 151766]
MIRRLIAPLAGLLLGASSALAGPALWKVSDGDSSVWLFGSVHLLPPGIDWRSSAFDKILTKADRVYFETDIGIAAQMEIAPLSFELGFIRDGKLLSERIGPDMTAQLRQVAADYDVPMPMLLTMQPWMAATTLSLGVLAEIGYDPTLGVDPLLSNELPMERKGFLETPQEQIAVLASGDEGEQIAMLQATLDTIHNMQDDIDAMVKAWMEGEPEALGHIAMAQMGGYDESMIERLIDIRNHNWAEQIEAMLARNEQALLIVGAAHLVGDISVVRLLEQRGFTSERVQ